MAGVVPSYEAAGSLSDVRRSALVSLVRKVKARDRADMLAAIFGGAKG